MYCTHVNMKADVILNILKVAVQENRREHTEEKEDDSNSIISVRSYYEDSEEPNPADFLEACMVCVFIDF